MVMGKILLVDDSEVARFDVVAVLGEAGYEILEATDGLEGVEMAVNNTGIKMILADYNMPEMNGLVMIDTIKKKTDYSRVFCAILTTESSSALKELGRAVGVDLWITKPIDPDGLLTLTHKVFAM
tara:strand:+ start:1605 stop:1979 length:375 start_codon:yes stop_codon:yes gene_type:complete